MMKIALTILAMAGLSACASPLPPTSFPNLDKEATRPALIVANIGKGVGIPPPEDCKAKPHPPSGALQRVTVCSWGAFYVKAEVLATLHGRTPRSPLFIGSGSHWGAARVDQHQSPVLIALLTDGKHATMPRNAVYALVADSSGELYLPLRGRVAPDRPCPALALREEIDPANFPLLKVFAEKDLLATELASTEDWFRPAAGGYYPRYAIAIKRLKAHLAEVEPNLDGVLCASW